MTLGSMTLGAAAASTANGTRSDALLQLLELETDMLHAFSPPLC
jgi:hypothetical protein